MPDLNAERKRRAGLADDGTCPRCGVLRYFCRGHPHEHVNVVQPPPHRSFGGEERWPPPRCLDCGQNLYERVDGVSADPV